MYYTSTVRALSISVCRFAFYWTWNCLLLNLAEVLLQYIGLFVHLFHSVNVYRCFIVSTTYYFKRNAWLSSIKYHRSILLLKYKIKFLTLANITYNTENFNKNILQCTKQCMTCCENLYFPSNKYCVMWTNNNEKKKPSFLFIFVLTFWLLRFLKWMIQVTPIKVLFFKNRM